MIICLGMLNIYKWHILYWYIINDLIILILYHLLSNHLLIKLRLLLIIHHLWVLLYRIKSLNWSIKLIII